MPVIGAAGAILLWSGTAHARLVTTGVGPVYDGISHLFVTFDDLLAVAAMAFLAGLNGPAAGRCLPYRSSGSRAARPAT